MRDSKSVLLRTRKIKSVSKLFFDTVYNEIENQNSRILDVVRDSKDLNGIFSLEKDADGNKSFYVKLLSYICSEIYRRPIDLTMKNTIKNQLKAIKVSNVVNVDMLVEALIINIICVIKEDYDNFNKKVKLQPKYFFKVIVFFIAVFCINTPYIFFLRNGVFDANAIIGLVSIYVTLGIIFLWHKRIIKEVFYFLYIIFYPIISLIILIFIYPFNRDVFYNLKVFMRSFNSKLSDRIYTYLITIAMVSLIFIVLLIVIPLSGHLLVHPINKVIAVLFILAIFILIIAGVVEVYYRYKYIMDEEYKALLRFSLLFSLNTLTLITAIMTFI